MAFADNFLQPSPPDGPSYNVREAVCWWNDPNDLTYTFVRFSGQPNSPVRFLTADWEAAYLATVVPDPVAPILDDAYLLNELSSQMARASVAFDPRAMAFVGNNIRRQRYMVVGGTPFRADLVERDATNYLTTSETFAGFTLTGLTSAPAADPIGGLTAQRLTSAGANSVTTNSTPLDAGFPHTFSLFAKLVPGSAIEQVALQHPSVGYAVFDLVNQTTTLGSWQAGGIEPVNAAGWYRVWARFTPGAPGASTQSWEQYDGAGLPAAGALDVWGAQVERSFYATSYIRTVGVAVSRIADDLVLDMSAYPTDVAGTWFGLAVPYNWDESYTVGNASNTLMQAETPSADFLLQRNTSIGLLNARSSHEGAGATTSVVSANAGAGTYQPGQLLTMALAWDGAGTELWVNGVSLGTAATPTLPYVNVSHAQCGNRPDLAQAFDGWVSFLCWDTRLTGPDILALHNASAVA